jgi:hypothetical protein
MRELAFAIFFFITNFVSAQRSNNIPVNTIHKDSSEQLIYSLKDSLRRLQYECFFYNHLYSKDSSSFGSDSVIINYKSISGRLIKRHIKRGYSIDGFTYEKIVHYNNSERPEFTEHWELARSSQDTTGNYFIWRIYSYDRFIYDTIGRLVTWIQYHPTYISRSMVARRDFKYDVDGKQTSVRTLIPIVNFWD